MVGEAGLRSELVEEVELGPKEGTSGMMGVGAVVVMEGEVDASRTSVEVEDEEEDCSTDVDEDAAAALFCSYSFLARS